MANIPDLYNFYRRYLWNEHDFAGWQDGMVELGRGMFEGTFGAAVLKGYDYTLSGGLGISVGTGIAVGPTGNLLVVNAVSPLTLTAPTAAFERALIVVRPHLVDGDYITKPTDPLVQVPLTTAQEATVLVLRGVAANAPVYPAPAANDTVLMGVRLALGQVTLAAADIDLEVRDTPGKNSNFQQDAAKYDNRLRPGLVSGSPTLAVYPSQLEPPLTRVFSYVNKVQPSIFPKSAGGAYNGAAGLTYLNFQTGAITGADEASADFTPQIPTTGNAIVACVSIASTDTLRVTYGTQGTRAQCLEGVKSQVASGAGSVSLPDVTKPIAFVILFSGDGVSITEADLFDCRGAAAVGSGAGVASGGMTTPAGGSYPLTLTGSYDGKVVNVDTSVARTLTLPAPVAGFKVTVFDYVGTADQFPITIGRSAVGVKIMGLASDYACAAPFGSWTFDCDGTDYWLI